MILLVASLITLLSDNHSTVDTFDHDAYDISVDPGADYSPEILVKIISKTC